MADNYSCLQRNTLDGLSEAAGVLYLKLIDAFEAHRSPKNERRAFLAACEFDEKVGSTLDYILRNSTISAGISDQTITDLSTFFAKRWRHNFMTPA